MAQSPPTSTLTAPALTTAPTPTPTPTPTPDFGFIITRHVQTKTQNLYWNQCVYQLRRLYGPGIKIVIIDDASNQSLVAAHADYENVEIIQSEYPGRGELLPYVYYFRRGAEWFQRAIIIHDSVFFHRKYDFSRMNRPVMFLWHHEYDYDNLANSRRMVSFLSQSTRTVPGSKFRDRDRNQTRSRVQNQDMSLYNAIVGSEQRHLQLHIRPIVAQEHFSLCFGAMTAIQHTALCRIEANYSILRLVNVIRCRTDRCTFERILGVIIGIEYPYARLYPSLFGDIITNHYKSFSYTFDEYVHDVKSRGIFNKYGVIKVWTGR